MKLPSCSSVCPPGSDAGAFFASILFAFAALTALANSAFALTIPRPARKPA